MPASTVLIVFGSWALLLVLTIVYYLGGRHDDADS